MGREQFTDSTNKVYMKPQWGWITEKVDPNNPNQQVETFEYEIGGEARSSTKAVNRGIIGMITNVRINTDSKFGALLEIDMLDGPEAFCLQMKPDSSEAFDFYARMEKIDYSKEVRFAHFKPKDSDYYKLVVSQWGMKKDRDTGKDTEEGWVSVKFTYSMDEVPSWEKDDLGGWDKSPTRKFYTSKIPELMKNIALHGNTPKKEVADVSGEDDLPF